MARPPRYTNVAPPPPERSRLQSICQSCHCPNCHDTESCNGSVRVVNGGYIRSVADKPPPPPCRQRTLTDNISQGQFTEVAPEPPKPNTRGYRDLDKPLPLPSEQNNTPVFDNQTTFPKHGDRHLSMQDRFIRRHPSPQSSVDSQVIPKHRKPSDELPVPGSNHPLMTEQNVKAPEKKPNLFIDLTLPRPKSEIRHRRKSAAVRVSLKIKLGTIAGMVLFFGLLYLVIKLVQDLFFVHRRHPRPPTLQSRWNYSEPDESKLDTTVCFSCELADEFKTRLSKHQQNNHGIYGFKSSDNNRHCCMDQLGHTKWMVNMLKTSEILAKQQKRNDSVCPATRIHVSINSNCSKGGEARLELDEIEKPKYHVAGINVTNDSLVAVNEGLFIVYMSLTVTDSSQLECGKKDENKKVIQAHLHCSKSAKKKCIEMETYNISSTGEANVQHVFHLYTLKKFTTGEHFFPNLSHPSYLYSGKQSNYIGVVKLC